MNDWVLTSILQIEKNNTCRRIQTSPAQHFARAKWYVNDVTLIFVHEHVDAINKTMVAALQYVFTSLIFSWVFICGSSISWDYPFKTCKDVLTGGFRLYFIFGRVKSNIVICMYLVRVYLCHYITILKLLVHLLALFFIYQYYDN